MLDVNRVEEVQISEESNRIEKQKLMKLLMIRCYCQAVISEIVVLKLTEVAMAT